MPVPYPKPHLDIPDQLALLESRGMAVADRVRAAHYLRRLGYYRLSGYWYPARERQMVLDTAGKTVMAVTDKFRPGTTFERAVDLYVFDKRLRLLFLDAIERIEVALRVDAALLLSVRDPLAHRDPLQVHRNFATKIEGKTGLTRHAAWIGRLDKATAQSKEEFVSRFQAKYSSPLPIWIAVELWDFGMLSHFVSGMKHPDLVTLAGAYQLTRPELLASWIRNINNVRNVCAHHGRLWNRDLTDDPKRLKPGEIPALDHVFIPGAATSRIYTTGSIIQHFMRQVSPHSSWGTRFKQHIATFPAGPGITLFHAGFRPDWEAQALWSS
jgi:abortive infection bacteriophage resistance protein